MTEKLYKMVNTNLVDDDGLVYYLIKKDGRDVCQVFGKHTAKAIVTELNSLHEDNEQLKQRNNRQAKQLDRLYNLIEEKDWKALSDIIDDFKRCEEQLQREWRTYSV